MPERPHPVILNRADAENLVATHFSAQRDLIDELANYGSNLCLRTYNVSSKNLGDIVACGVLLKQVVAMLDATSELFKSGCVYAANLPARAGFEASLYLEWMLASDLDRKAHYYYVANLRSERQWALRAIQGTAEHGDFATTMGQLGVDLAVLRPNLKGEAEKHLAEVNRILGQQEFSAIDEEFAKKRGKKKHDQEWYSLLGVNSVRQIAERLHRLAEYDLFYARGSTVTHAASYKDHVRFGAGQVRFKQIRSLEGIDALLNFIVAFAIRSYQWVLTYYRPDELPQFWEQYRTDWRSPFVSVKEVVYRSDF